MPTETSKPSALCSLGTLVVWLLGTVWALIQLLDGNWWGLPALALLWLVTALDPNIGRLRSNSPEETKRERLLRESKEFVEDSDAN